MKKNKDTHIDNLLGKFLTQAPICSLLVFKVMSAQLTSELPASYSM